MRILIMRIRKLALGVGRQVRWVWIAGLLACMLLTSSSWAKDKGPFAEELGEIKTNLKAFGGVKKIAIVGVVEVLEDMRSGKQEFSYQKIPSQKLVLRFNYLIPEGFTLLNRSAADVDQMLREGALSVGDLLNFSQVAALGQSYGADALLVGAYYSGTKNGYDVEVQSSVFVRLIDVKTGALIWTRELDRKDLQVPGAYTRVAAPSAVKP